MDSIIEAIKAGLTLKGKEYRMGGSREDRVIVGDKSIWYCVYTPGWLDLRMISDGKTEDLYSNSASEVIRKAVDFLSN